jgi:hypothetical protein
MKWDVLACPLGRLEQWRTRHLHLGIYTWAGTLFAPQVGPDDGVPCSMANRVDVTRFGVAP